MVLLADFYPANEGWPKNVRNWVNMPPTFSWTNQATHERSAVVLPGWPKEFRYHLWLLYGLYTAQWCVSHWCLLGEVISAEIANTNSSKRSFFPLSRFYARLRSWWNVRKSCRKSTAERRRSFELAWTVLKRSRWGLSSRARDVSQELPTMLSGEDVFARFMWIE